MRKSRIRLWHGGALALALSGLLVAVLVVTKSEPDEERRPGPPGDGPLTMVSIGDSSLSGEGTGDYTPETDGLDGNWCHRSPRATVHMTDVPGIEKTVNLACSGAATRNVRLTDERKYTEPSQAGQLRELVRDHRVAAVVVAVGGNDDPAFAHRVTECAKAWFSDTPCSARLAPQWQERVDAMAPKIVDALTDIRAVLADAGYREDDYQLVLQSYPSPVGPGIPEDLRNLNGCPFTQDDLRWIRDDAVPMISEAMRGAAEQVGARFLDLSRAGDGREACSGGNDQSTEWFSRLMVRWDDLSDVDRAPHAAQESFHTNIAGHWQLGRCLTEFLSSDDAHGVCERVEDGNLRAIPRDAASAASG